MIKNIIVEAVDRLGKSTLIDGIQQHLGFFQEIHYQKPKKLNRYQNYHLGKPDQSSLALRDYQEASFTQMFMMLSQPGRYILDRAHLGEFVYSQRYRQYDGSYVFDLEKKFTHDHGSKFTETTLLILLTTSDFSFIVDDGLSHDFSKKEEEQDDFIRAFNRSTIKNKLMIDVAGKNGTYRDKYDILCQVLKKLVVE